jgi:hypothetical protein
VAALLLGRKIATSNRFDTECFKEAAGDLGDVDTHRFGAAGNRR